MSNYVFKGLFIWFFLNAGTDDPVLECVQNKL